MTQLKPQLALNTADSKSGEICRLLRKGSRLYQYILYLLLRQKGQQLLFQRITVHRFGEVVRKSQGQIALFGSCYGVRCQADHRSVPVHPGGPDVVQCFSAVHHRHSLIHQNQVIADALTKVYGLLTAENSIQLNYGYPAEGSQPR